MMVNCHVGAGDGTQVLCKEQVLSAEPSPEALSTPPPYPDPHPQPRSPAVTPIAPSPVSHDLCRPFFEMGSRVFTSVQVLQHCPDQGKVDKVGKRTPKNPKTNLPALQPVSMTTRPATVGRWSAARHFQFICFRVLLMPPRRALGVKFGSAEKHLSPLLTPSLRSSRSPTRHRFPPLFPRPRAQPRSNLPQGPPPCVTSGQNTSGLRLPPVLFSVLGAGGSGGAVRARVWRRSLSWRAAAGKCRSGRRAGPCARCHQPGPWLRPCGRGCSGRLVLALRGDGTRAPGAPGGRHRAMALSWEGRLTWFWTHRVTLAESLCLRILVLQVCEEGRGGLPGLRWAWKEDTVVARCRGAAGI